MLAFLYRYGLGTDQDVTKAAELEKFAAELNYTFYDGGGIQVLRAGR